MTKIPKIKKNRAKNLRINVGKVKNISIGQRLVLNKHGLIRLKENEKNQEVFSIDELNFSHLDIVLESLRSDNWNHLIERKYALAIFISMKLAGIQRKKIAQVLENLGTYHVDTVQNYAKKIILGDNLQVFEEETGKYFRPTVFDVYPDLKDEIKTFVIEKVSQINSNFNVNMVRELSLKKLAEFDDQNDYSLLLSPRFINKTLVSWGFTWGNNKKRPFFQGHEREDVVQSRNEFVKYFSESKSLFDRLIKTEKETDFLEHSWENAEKNVKRVIIFHDETSFRSGEVQNQKWLHIDYSPFFKRGRGVTKMLSDFIIAEKSFSLFELNDDEWEEALKNEPILNKESQLGFLSKSATSIITPTKDNYFNNESIHEQFSRLFTLIKYSKFFKKLDFRIDLVVDNATTHTTKYVDANMFALKINKSCPVEYLEWNDDKGNHKIDCYFREDPNVNESKGLLQKMIQLLNGITDFLDF